MKWMARPMGPGHEGRRLPIPISSHPSCRTWSACSVQALLMGLPTGLIFGSVRMADTRHCANRFRQRSLTMIDMAERGRDECSSKRVRLPALNHSDSNF